MRIDFVSEISSELNLDQKDRIEKDVVIHSVLSDLSKDAYFKRNFLFKGGTCLIKGYYGYVRFSEDIDFTWKDQNVFRNKPANQLRRMLSATIDKIGGLFEGIARQRGLDFKCKKDDRRYIELGGSDKSCTFYLRYMSEVLKRETYIKAQFNFVELICFKGKVGKLTSLRPVQRGETGILFPEFAGYSKGIPFPVYDIKEILAEKVRAILTRRGVKARDFLDAYLIEEKYKVRPADVEKQTIQKTLFALKLYERYRAQFEANVIRLSAGAPFTWGEEKNLLIQDIDERKFQTFLKEFQVYLGQVSTKVQESAKASQRKEITVPRPISKVRKRVG